MMSLRTCRTCGETKPTAEFYHRHRAGRVHVSRDCKPCIVAQVKAWRQANPNRYRTGRRKMKWGITPADFAAMLAAQGGGCFICGSTSSRNAQSPDLVIDHCHKTGRVRGLLCHPCNVGLGGFGDDPALLRRAITYLARTEDARPSRPRQGELFDDDLL